MFDIGAARAVYRFCLHEGVRMHVVGRDAVPLLPMALAKEFADRSWQRGPTAGADADGSGSGSASSSGSGSGSAKTAGVGHRSNPVMAYLYDAQKLGLVGLWANVCAAE